MEPAAPAEATTVEAAATTAVEAAATTVETAATTAVEATATTSVAAAALAERSNRQSQAKKRTANQGFHTRSPPAPA